MKLLINKKYLLEKYPGKGGWTYAMIHEITPDKRNKFGWVRVQGTIDGYEIKAYKLMPMGNGKLFLPLKAEIRKKIKKEAGDIVHVKLYLDDSPMEIPDDLIACLEDTPGIFERFKSYSESEKKMFIDWIYSAKREETKADRIVKTIDKLSKGLKFMDKG